MIISDTIKIKFINDNSMIEKELLKSGINPLRWAIVAVTQDELTISVSYQKNDSAKT